VAVALDFTVAVRDASADEPRETRKCVEQRGMAALEKLAPGRVDRFWVLEVLLEEGADEPGVQVHLAR
jgi:hypothetical protein